MLSPLPAGYDQLNRYSSIVVDEALRRGISVEIVDPSTGEVVLTHGVRRVRTVQSLSELTSALAFRVCDHKGLTREAFERAGLRVPEGRLATFDDGDAEFLDRWGDIVVKPVRGEGGQGITVGVTDRCHLAAALDAARAVCSEVLLERRHDGDDLRILVIAGEVVAASVRRPPTIVGDGRRTIAALTEELDRARSAATGGSSRVPLDATTAAVVAAAGFRFDDVLPAGVELAVRRTANLHTGGTISDVTDRLHPELAAVALRAAEVIGAPVLGLDLIVASVEGPDHVLIEAKEQPGLANHEPQPTAERFLDLLFPETATPP